MKKAFNPVVQVKGFPFYRDGGAGGGGGVPDTGGGGGAS
jgi:hypothetical protein